MHNSDPTANVVPDDYPLDYRDESKRPTKAGAQGTALLARGVVNQRHLRLGHLEGVGAADAVTPRVDLHHDAVRLGRGLVEDRLENGDDELHRGVVVVVEDHAEKGRPLGRRPRLLENVASCFGLLIRHHQLL